ncbi:hypothetical protein H2198_010331 [Neophaeococcomyces mojaviensis]|uniref:Uncharacterized protein n=1 Tax=Neophaeococcomyces mojaviensis TaxID=3383035 RepID=A0ACC2ZRY8_9EURO|nr:hypothetical protein H2198_010331 [Knufia sp. JES_112]
MAYQVGHRYGNNVISGSAQVLQGDSHVHQHHYHGCPLRPEKYELLHRSLSFDRMDARLHNIETPLSQTCTWLQSHEKFVTWTNPSQVEEHHGLLWLKGKPGSGKSTIMKKTLEWAKAEWKDQVILSYFFNARASDKLEKSCLGLYRSLIYQLLSALESIRTLFVEEFSSKERDGHVESWAEAELQNFLLKLISFKDLTRLNIFIDALDEGDEDDIQRMVAFFEKTADYSILAGSIFRLCLSSRHYPHISIEIGISITVEHQHGHTRDIETYIERTLPGRNNVLMTDIRDALLRKAGHVFLWVVLSVSLLRPLYNRGRVKEMKSKLEGIPTDLYTLFSAIITKEKEDLDKCITLLRWMLVSQRTLSPNELYLAVHSRHEASDIQEVEVFDPQTVVNYILSCSRGLVEITTRPLPRVQFIHETVRQFLISTEKHGEGIQQAWPDFIDFRLETCHNVVAEDCLEYLLQVCRKAPLTTAILERLPLADYSARYWWRHMQAIMDVYSSRSLDLAVQLLMGNRTNLLTWIQIYNVDRTSRRQILRRSKRNRDLRLVERDLAPPTYYAACIGVLELVQKLVLLKVNLDAEGGVHGSVLQTASYNGHEKVVQILLDQGADVNAQGGIYGSALHAASCNGHKEVVQVLLDQGADVNTQGGDYGSALYIASREGYENVVQILLDQGADVNARGGLYGSALHAASRHGYRRVVQMLYGHGAKAPPRTCAQ